MSAPIFRVRDVGRLVELDQAGHRFWALDCSCGHTVLIVESGGNLLAGDCVCGKTREIPRAPRAVPPPPVIRRLPKKMRARAA